MGRTTFANARNFSHKASSDKSLCTAPDVCKTPIGNSTPPIPYFVVSQVGDLAGGSSSVKLEGNPTTLKSSNHKSCSGDEPGTAKGVGSGSTSKKTEMTSYSPDVKCDGENVVRAFDTTTMNNKNTMGMILGTMTSPEVVDAIDVAAWDLAEVLPWLKMRACYDDTWQTPWPLPNVKISVNGETVKEGIQLPVGVGKNTHSYTLEQAKKAGNEPGTCVVENLPEGKATCEQVPDAGVQKQIDDLKAEIKTDLDNAYKTLVTDMKVFQEAWDESVMGLAIITSYEKGKWDGGKAWGNDQLSLFDAESWSKLGDMAGEVYSATFDYTASYAKGTYKDMVKSANELTNTFEENKNNFRDWGWWGSQIKKSATNVVQGVVDDVDGLEQSFNNAVTKMNNNATLVTTLYQHRERIMHLPEDISSGDSKKVQKFVTEVLVKIDPKFVEELLKDPEYYLVLEVIEDHDMALLYVGYMQMFIKAVPPNFYSYYFGKGSAYIALEVFLAIGLGFVSLGAGTAARLTALAARFAGLSAQGTVAVNKAKKAKAALDAFVAMINVFKSILEKMKSVARLRLQARPASWFKNGMTKSTAMAKKDTGKRKKGKCRDCGSKDHDTPESIRKGEINYV